MKRSLCLLGTIFLFLSVEHAVLQAQSAKQIKQFQTQQRQMEALRKRQENLQKQQENNVRSLCLLMHDEETQKKLKITEKQKIKLDELGKKYDEIREKTVNPDGRKFGPGERMEAVKSKQGELQKLSLKGGQAIMQILTREQLDLYGRLVTYERAKKAWERRMGIEPIKPQSKTAVTGQNKPPKKNN